MFPLENRVGINITKDKLQYVEYVYLQGEFILDHLDEAYFTEEIDYHNEKEAKIQSVLQAAFNEIVTDHKVKSKYLFVTLPASLFRIARLPYENSLLEQDIITELKWEMDQLYPYGSNSEYSIQFHQIENKESALRYAIAASLDRKYLRLMKNFAQKNGFTLSVVDFAHFACDSALFYNYNTAADDDVLSIFLDEHRLSAEFISSGKALHFRFYSYQSYNEIPRLIQEIVSSYVPLTKQNRRLQTAFIFGDSITPALVDTWEKTTGLKYYPVNPFKKITISQKLAHSKLLKEHFYKFSAAAGICYRMA
jgi:hypothetical protein